ncbi:MAG: hypothetical protein ACRET7_13670, partial [Burkholderiales bacterium]
FIGSPEMIAYKICHEQPALPSEAGSGRCTTQFDAVMMKALAKKPEERYQNADTFREAMLGAYAEPLSPAVSEQTIINEFIRPSGQRERSQPSSPSGPSPLSQSTPSQPPGWFPDPAQPAVRTIPPPGWDAEVLKQIERQLMRIVGPVAKVMVRRGATRTTELDILYRMLAESLTNPAEHTAFLAGRQRLQGVPRSEPGATTVLAPTAQAPATGLTVQLTTDAIEEATRRLTAYIGPIAKIVAKRAATQATSRRHFHMLLAEKLTDPKERARFLHDVGAE